jgi:sulfide:quinone oxidoreductase
VIGVAGVYAAGDAADFPIKQGGLATQQADVIAEAIAARAGAAAEPSGFRPVLRAVLLTGEEARYIESEVGEGAATATVSTTPLWPHASKVRGRFLAPYLETLDERRVSQPRE